MFLTAPYIIRPSIVPLLTSSTIHLIKPGNISSRLSFSRAQITGVESTLFDGVIWQKYNADVPRFWGSARRLRIEGQRTDAIRNPRFEGASVGAPGSPGTNLTLTQPGSGIASAIAGIGTDAGASYLDVRVSGTASAIISSGTGLLSFDTTAAIAAATGQTWSAAVSVRVVAGTFSGTLVQDISERLSGGGLVRQNNTALSNPSATEARVSSTSTLSGGVTTAFVQHVLRWGCASGTVVDFTLRIKLPQLELGAFASTPVLPPALSPAAATRGADLVTASLANLGIPPSGACTVLWSGVLHQTPPSGANQMLIHVDDGGASNRFMLLNELGTNSIAAWRYQGGAFLASSTAGSMVPGTPLRAGITCDGAGRVAVSLGGAAAVSVSGAPTSGLTTIRVGAAQNGGGNMFGDVGYLDIIPRPVDDATLQRLVTAMPLI